MKDLKVVNFDSNIVFLPFPVITGNIFKDSTGFSIIAEETLLNNINLIITNLTSETLIGWGSDKSFLVAQILLLSKK